MKASLNDKKGDFMLWRTHYVYLIHDCCLLFVYPKNYVADSVFLCFADRY